MCDEQAALVTFCCWTGRKVSYCERQIDWWTSRLQLWALQRAKIKIHKIRTRCTTWLINLALLSVRVPVWARTTWSEGVWYRLAYAENTICLALLLVWTLMQTHLHFRASAATSRLLRTASLGLQHILIVKVETAVCTQNWAFMSHNAIPTWKSNENEPKYLSCGWKSFRNEKQTKTNCRKTWRVSSRILY